MTSSLVGSEMCIRDSNLTRVQLLFIMGSDIAFRCFFPSGCSTTQSTDDTVSYTHLTLPTICSV
eukprot:11911877-Prorocentrum_lima.AAC.1